jgi:hypothetical protein
MKDVSRGANLERDQSNEANHEETRVGIARVKGVGVGRNHEVECSRAPPEALGTDPNPGMGPREERAYGRHHGRIVLSKLRNGDA